VIVMIVFNTNTRNARKFGYVIQALNLLHVLILWETILLSLVIINLPPHLDKNENGYGSIDSSF